jgi:hypothetical protein
MPEKEQPTAVPKKEGWRKWLGRFGTFLIYGGWILMFALVLGIAVIVSTC